MYQRFQLPATCRRLAYALVLGALVSVAPSAKADRGADMAVRLLQGVIGASSQQGTYPSPNASRTNAGFAVQLRSPPLYRSKEEWLQALREQPGPRRPESPLDDEALASTVWLVLNAPESVVGWPSTELDWMGFKEGVVRNLRNTDDELARVLNNQPPTFRESSIAQLQNTVNMASRELGNPGSMAGCRVGGQPCSTKLLGFFQEYVKASLEGLEKERQSRVTAWKQQEAMRQQAEQKRQAALDAVEQERKNAEAARIRAEAERVRAEEERCARQRASRVGG